MEGGGEVRHSIDIVRQTEAARSENLEKLVCEVIAVVGQKVVSISTVLETQIRQQYLKDFSVCQLANILILLRVLISLVLDHERATEGVVTVLSWRRQLQARLSTDCVPAE